jgi:hypothetical protein
MRPPVALHVWLASISRDGASPRTEMCLESCHTWFVWLEETRRVEEEFEQICTKSRRTSKQMHASRDFDNGTCPIPHFVFHGDSRKT